MKYLVIDTYALSFRALYGYPDLTNNKGEPTSVIIGFFKQFLSRVHAVEEYYPIFVTDMPGSADVRKELYPDYKANRTAADASFYEQVDFILSLGALIGTVYKHPGREADDLAGAFVERYADKNEITLLTVDADWLQLLRKNVTVIQLKTNGIHVRWDDALFFAEKKIAPKQLIDLKAIVGDGSDNIPGVKGLGEATGIELLREFDSIDDIYNNIIKVTTKRKVQQKLIENEEMVRRNRQLVSLNTSVDTWTEPQTVITDKTIDKFIDMFSERTNSIELTNLLGVYLQRRKSR
jgi:5'-3' exonuclease